MFLSIRWDHEKQKYRHNFQLRRQKCWCIDRHGKSPSPKTIASFIEIKISKYLCIQITSRIIPSLHRLQSIKSGVFISLTTRRLLDNFHSCCRNNFNVYRFYSRFGWVLGIVAANERENFRCEIVHFKVNDITSKSKWLGQ